MRILVFAASNNPQSINQQLALSVARLLPQAEVIILVVISYIPCSTCKFWPINRVCYGHG